DDVTLDALVDAVDHRRERRRLARARGSGEQNQSGRAIREIGNHLRELEIVEALDVERNLPDDHRDAAALLEAVAAEAREILDAERKIQLVLHLEALLLVFREHRVSDLH